MKLRMWYALSILLAVAPIASAQNRVTVRPVPVPGQIVHLATTLEFSIFGESVASGHEPGRGAIVTSSFLAFTQSNGPFDDQNRMTARLTLERLAVEQTLNGKPKPQRDMGQIAGSSVTVVFDRTGRLVDITVPKELQHASGILKQMVSAAYGVVNVLPSTMMGIGETVTVPSATPMAASAAGARVPAQTLSVVTLREIDAPGPHRVAHLVQRITSAADTNGVMDVMIDGEGTVAVNLDRGFVTASATQWKISGGYRATSPAPAKPFEVRGSIKVTVAAHE